ncbi:nucleolin 2, partial [Arabidopsis lyrata subsp. lyrata]|uniref:nucleolin 2 n=1 Tax=Arabidopsis lyrata subsp. lyrata TaxID=81972 RepID=UPI000A29CB0C
YFSYEDYLRRQKLLLEEDETPPDSVEAVAAIKKTLFVTHLFHQTVISHIINFFKDVGEVVHVRLIVNHKGKNVGCGFVQFASIDEAKKALRKKCGKNFLGRDIFLDVAEIAPYPLRPRYNLAEKLWYEDYLRQESLLIEEDDLETKPNLKKQKVPTMGEFCGNKITFSEDSEDSEGYEVYEGED